MYKTNMFNFYKFHKYYSSSEQIKNLSKFKKGKYLFPLVFIKIVIILFTNMNPIIVDISGVYGEV